MLKKTSSHSTFSRRHTTGKESFISRRTRFTSSSTPRKSLFILMGLLLVSVVFFFVFTQKGREISSILASFLLRYEIEFTDQKRKTINVLVLGIGGGVHDGPNLTDTIIFAHINPEKNSIKLVAIPRDLWIADLQAKINTAYAYGLERDGKGILLAKSTVEKVVGLPIDYTVVVDFKGFVTLVDLLGGIEVDVVRAFSDNYYPIPGKESDPCGVPEMDIETLISTASSEFDIFPCRYQSIQFEAGRQLMNGERALLYVRSRHASGAEGSDFARSKRQNQVIAAVKEKVLSLGTLVNPVKVFEIIDTIKDNISTDISAKDTDDFIKLAQKMQESATIENYVIDQGDTAQKRYGLLYHPPISPEQRNQWVLVPRVNDGEFSEIHEYITCVMQYSDCEVNEDGLIIRTSQVTSTTPRKP